MNECREQLPSSPARRRLESSSSSCTGVSGELVAVRKCHAETPVGARSAARFRPLACGNEGDNWLHRQRVGEASLDGAELSQSRLIGLRQAAQLSSAVVSLYIVCMHVRYE